MVEFMEESEAEHLLARELAAIPSFRCNSGVWRCYVT
jgi:hypothetical protein